VVDAIDRGFIRADDVRGLSHIEMRAIVSGQHLIIDGYGRVAKVQRGQAEEAARLAEKAEKEADRKWLEGQAKVYAEQADINKKAAEREAKCLGIEAAKAIREGEIGWRGIVRLAAQRMPSVTRDRIYTIDELARKIAKAFGRFVAGKNKFASAFAFLMANRGDLSSREAEALDQSLEQLIKCLEEMRQRLKVSA
jgi:hypothetical protein